MVIVATSHKVLMTLMGMEIGGAETHVLELSKTLKHMGLDVHVVSNGGVYVRELEECGIKHYRVPLHNKQFINVFSSYRALKKIILENDIQLVHAHARIPAFICGILQKRLKFKLVTSAHLDFSVAFPFNLLSNWGDKVLAVSSDIKDYLLANYKVEERNISLTVNGIDTQKFTPDIDYSSIIAELGLEKDSIKVLSVSRMDKREDSDRSLPAKLLIQMADELPDNVQVVLVGGGDALPEMRQMADEANTRLNRPMFYVTGPRTDISLFMAMADIFVNTSRSALEALSAGTPLILGGNQGYIGIFDETKLPVAVETNFTCRGCKPMTKETLAADLKILLDSTQDARKALGAYGREVIAEHYSLDIMAKDAIAVYDKVFAPDNPINIVISGYYGYNNSGDDIMLKSIVRNLRALRNNLNLTVLSIKPKETRAQFGVDAVHRFNLLSVFLRLRKAKLLITGGGNLIQDETSTQSLLYYLLVIHTARFFGVKNMLYAKGIGPINRRGNVARVRRSINRVDLITLRERSSLDVLKTIGITKPETHVTADAAFALPPSEGGEAYLSEFGIEGPFFCVALRPWTHNPADLEIQVARFSDHLIETYGYKAVFIQMLPEQDSEISRRVMALMKHDAIFVDSKDDDMSRTILGLSSFALCMRLHALIFAMEKGVPAIGLEYNSKIRGFMDVMSQKWHVPVEDTNAETLIQFAKEIHENKAEISAEIYDAGVKLRDLASRNAELCVELLEK